MKTVTLTCHKCRTPVQLTYEAAAAWEGITFLCDTCLGHKIKRVVQAGDIAKAEAQTRAFLTINLNPTTYENPKHRTQPPPPTP